MTASYLYTYICIYVCIYTGDGRLGRKREGARAPAGVDDDDGGGGYDDGDQNIMDLSSHPNSLIRMQACRSHHPRPRADVSLSLSLPLSLALALKRARAHARLALRSRYIDSWTRSDRGREREREDVM